MKNKNQFEQLLKFLPQLKLIQIKFILSIFSISSTGFLHIVSTHIYRNLIIIKGLLSSHLLDLMKHLRMPFIWHFKSNIQYTNQAVSLSLLRLFHNIKEVKDSLWGEVDSTKCDWSFCNLNSSLHHVSLIIFET